MATNEHYVNRIKAGENVNENMTALYNQNMGFLRAVVKPYTIYTPEDDLLQEAYFGLYTAALKYDQSRDASFLVYAEYWIRQAALRYLENYSSEIRIPASRRQQVYQYRKIQETYKAQQRPLTDNAICKLMNISKSALEAVKVADTILSSMRSLDTPINADDDITLADMVASPGDFTEEILHRVECSQLRRALLFCISQLPERESYIIQHYYFEGELISAMAADLGVSESVVSSTKKRALQRLKDNYSDKLLPFYENIIAIIDRTPKKEKKEDYIDSWLWWRDPAIMAIYLNDKPRRREIMDEHLTEQLKRGGKHD